MKVIREFTRQKHSSDGLTIEEFSFIEKEYSIRDIVDTYQLEIGCTRHVNSYYTYFCFPTFVWEKDGYLTLKGTSSGTIVTFYEDSPSKKVEIPCEEWNTTKVRIIEFVSKRYLPPWKPS
jgi:hypothetical protein